MRRSPEAVENVFGAISSWILLYDTGIKQLRPVCSRGRGSDAFRDLTIPPDVGILGLAFTRRSVIFVPDVKADDRWFDAVAGPRGALQSVFTVPLMAGSDVLGVVGLDSPGFDADRPPGETDIARLEALAAQAAIAIANARLYSASEEDRRRLRSLLQEQHRLRSHVTHLEEQVKVTGAFGEIVGESAALKEAVSQAALAAPGDTTISCWERQAAARNFSRDSSTSGVAEARVHSCPSTVRRSPKRSSRANCSDTRKARSRVPSPASPGNSKSPIEEPSSLTRSATCRRKHRPSS